MSVATALAALVTALRAINGTGSYSTTVVSVNDKAVPPNTLTPTSMATEIDFEPKTIDYEDLEDIASVSKTIAIMLEANVAPAHDAPHYTAAVAVLADIETCVKANRTLGGTAEYVRIKGPASFQLGGDSAKVNLPVEIVIHESA